MSTSGTINQSVVSLVDEHKLKRPISEESEDRISSLPDELRTKIVSCLPFEDAFKTCILSKSWKHIFSTLPKLSFRENRFPNVANRVRRFAALVDWTLANYEGSEIESLEIRFNILKKSCVQLRNAWVHFAIEHNVRRLELHGKINARQGLPTSLFTCESLTEFSLAANTQLLKLPSAINLPNLTSLSLIAVIFPDDTLTEALFAGCPLLTGLYIGRCNMFRLARLTISCPKLEGICFSNCMEIDTCTIVLEGSCVKKFVYDGSLPRNFEFGNMVSLWTAILNLRRDIEDGRNDTELAPVALNLLRSMCHARDLTLSALFNEVLPKLGGEPLQLGCFENLKIARLYVWATYANQEIVMTLLSKFHRVEILRLIIHVSIRTSKMKHPIDTWSCKTRHNFTLGNGGIKQVEVLFG
ncbi:hypothetical protein RND81_06G122200 [Saponaria officinalis]|uniref:F-box domain-containing protein n=1 Tax=Saponaria officinalis TaxID=3572 RepID=A0AAW1K5A3_SAPOF